MKKHLIALFLILAASAPAVPAQDKPADRVKIDADQNYLILSTKKIQTMEKELDETAAKGFRVLYGAPTVTFDMALFSSVSVNPKRLTPTRFSPPPATRRWKKNSMHTPRKATGCCRAQLFSNRDF